MRNEKEIEEIPIESSIRYNGSMHKQINDKPINIGDTLVCVQNNCIGICDEIINGYVVIKAGWKSELTTRIENVRKLVRHE